MKKDAVPSIFPWNKIEVLKKKRKWVTYWKQWSKKEVEKVLKECIAEEALKNLVKKFFSLNDLSDEFVNEITIDGCEEHEKSVFESQHEVVEVVEDPNLQNCNFQVTKKFSFHFSVEDLQLDDKAIHFYTGLESYKKVSFVYSTLGSAVNKLTFVYTGVRPETISPFNQFFLTLIVLRQHKTYYEVGMLFGISEKQVGNVFLTWIRFMYLQWSEIPQWTSKDLVDFYTPKDFHFKFPGTRGILDATEIKIQKPGTPAAQQCTFSTYKNANTVKTVITISPAGLVTHLSPAYAGSTSDRQIMERSDLLSKLDPGDIVLADKGFNIQDLLAPYHVKLNIPSFFKKKNQLSTSEKVGDKKISSKRIHIERVIGLGKTYKILHGPLTACQTLLADEIIFVCYMLSNFRNPIVDPDA